MPYLNATYLLLFTGAGGSKPKRQRPRKLVLTRGEDGVLRVNNSLKALANHEIYMKQKEKEDRIRKRTETMKDMPISEYQVLRKEMV